MNCSVNRKFINGTTKSFVDGDFLQCIKMSDIDQKPSVFFMGCDDSISIVDFRKPDLQRGGWLKPYVKEATVKRRLVHHCGKAKVDHGGAIFSHIRMCSLLPLSTAEQRLSIRAERQTIWGLISCEHRPIQQLSLSCLHHI
ncbi:hypothetical protein PO909_001305 [Leuciscus waleckii]